MSSSGPDSESVRTSQGDASPAAETPVRVVGIGASAGGLEAYTEFLKALPSNTGMAYVLVPHLSPFHHSELAHILAGVTMLPVAQATEGDVVAPNHVYIVPPNRTVTLTDGRLHLDARPAPDGDPTTIDRLLRSLVAEQGPRAVGIVLSGTGSDGTMGLLAIKAGGGTTYVQAPTTAAHPGMPESALEAGCADFSLPPEAIARSLVSLAEGVASPETSRPPSAMAHEPNGPERWAEAARSSPDAEAEALETIAALLQATTGVDFRHYKRATVTRRIWRRCQDLRLPDLPAYIALLEQDPSEVRALFETMLIHFTSFFREPETFEALQRIAMPVLLAHRPAGAPIRAWIVGCSTGQEAYSTAIALLESTAAVRQDVPLQIFASDLSESALAIARSGQYSEAASAGVSPERLARFFVPVDGGYRVTQQVRDLCVFARHDVIRDPPFSHLDLVLCRNVLIYLDSMLQERVLQHLHYALKPSGLLALGSAERVGKLGELFTPVDHGQQLYTRRAAPTALHLDFARSGAHNSPRVSESQAILPLSQMSSASDLQRAAAHALFTAYPAATVIIDTDLEILHFQGRTSPYLETPTGGPTAQLLRMAHPDLQLVLGRMVRKAQRDGMPVRRLGIPIQLRDKRGRVDVTVIPFRDEDAAVQRYLIVFDPLRRAEAALGNPAPELPPEGSPQEMAEMKEYLQAIIDQQHATHVDLQRAHQAALANNEEYQSTNEELETTKEELQSLNEELTTLNEELHQRNVELNVRALEIASLLESMTMPVVMLSADLRVRNFNARAGVELELGPLHIGRRIAELQVPLPLSTLHELADRAIADGVMQEREVRDRQGRWSAFRVWPVLAAGGEASAVVFAMIDIGSLKERLDLAAAARVYSDTIVETVAEPLVVLDHDLRILTANRAFHRTFRSTPEDVYGVPFLERGRGEWDLPALRGRLDEVRQNGGSFDDYEVTIDAPSTGRSTFRLNARRIIQPGSEAQQILLALEDVTERKVNEQRLIEAARMQAVGQLAGGVAHEINNQMTGVLGFTELLLKSVEASDPKRSDLLEILKAAQRSADITRELLAFGRRQMLQPVILELNPLVAGAESLIRRVLGPHIVLHVVLGETVGQVRVDQARLEQAVVNLVLNARDAMPGGGEVTIETTTVTVADDAVPGPGGEVVPVGRYARLIVSDTGSGMDAATKARIFEPFFTTKEIGRGTGLGLASVYGTVKQSGGLIWVESEPGRGTTFTLDFPQVIGTAAPKTIQPRFATPTGGSGVILVVDDEDIVRTWASRLLQELGYTVVEANNGAEALRLALEPSTGVQVVVSDVVMPGMSGADVRARLAELRPDLPVLLMSGFATDELVRRALVAPGTAVLQKPFAGADLADRIERALTSQTPAPLG